MRTYKTVTEHPVTIKLIHSALGFKHKLPKDFTFEGDLELFSGGWIKPGVSLGVYKIKIIPAIKQGKPRIFVVHGSRLIPAGRTAQAKA